MSKISNEGLEQLQVVRNALDSMYNKLNKSVYIKNGETYKSINPFELVQEEVAGIAEILTAAKSWETV